MTEALLIDWTDGRAGRGHSMCKSRGLLLRAVRCVLEAGEKCLEEVISVECQA